MSAVIVAAVIGGVSLAIVAFLGFVIVVLLGDIHDRLKVIERHLKGRA